MAPSDPWSPEQYERFRAERAQPFEDLLALVQPAPGLRVIDLGCGTGELTQALAERLPGATVLGLDASPAMLARAAPRARPGLAFRQGDVRDVDDFGAFDLVFSHAALQWVPEHEPLIERILREVRPGAQVAVQVPRNYDHPSHRVAREVAAEGPFREALAGRVPPHGVLALERYAELLYAHGLREQVCLEKIYGHELARSADVVEWVRGTLLTAYLAPLAPPQQARFLAEYTARLREALGDRAPYFYPFRRLLFWGRKG